MTQYTYSDELYSDLYKDVHGFRPRGNLWQNWIESTPAEKQAQWDSLQESLDAQIEFDRRLQDTNRKRFMARVAQLVTHGAGNEATALRWIAESLGYSKLEFHTRDFMEYEYDLGCGWLVEYYPDVWEDLATEG